MVLLVNDWGISVSHQRCRCDEIVVVLAPPCQGFILVILCGGAHMLVGVWAGGVSAVTSACLTRDLKRRNGT